MIKFQKLNSLNILIFVDQKHICVKIVVSMLKEERSVIMKKKDFAK